MSDESEFMNRLKKEHLRAALKDTENESFYSLYQPYIVHEWRHSYLKYDKLKEDYKALKKVRGDSILIHYDIELHNCIESVDFFLYTQIEDLKGQIKALDNSVESLAQKDKKDAQHDQTQRTVEREIRRMYERSKELQNFFELNEFVIYKVAKKFEKLCDPDSDKHEDFEIWKRKPYRSCAYLHGHYLPKATQISSLRQACMSMYTRVFRQTYPALALGELEYTKNTNLENSWDLVFIGVKVGIIMNIAIWLIIDSFETTLKEDSFDFFNNPSIFIYSCIGNVMLFRLTWSFNVYYWSNSGVNYISLLQLVALKSNMQQILNETLTLFVLYFVNILLYFRSNNSSSYIYNSFLSYLSPVLLIVTVLVYLLYENYRFFSLDLRTSRGLFSMAVIKNIFLIPFIPVTFQASYACDVLTSFTKVISDSIFMSCYLLSGAFTLRTSVISQMSIVDFGNNGIQCASQGMIYASSFCVLVPLFLRASQCFRNIYDTKKLNPYIYNAGKYCASMLVVIYSHFRPGTVDQVFIVILVTLYKWWWDVVMDWGLFTSLPFIRTDYDSYVFLRKELMYKSAWVYYVAIVLNLVLRFFWVVSLVVSTTVHVPYIGPVFLFFLGSLEILRRSMWGVFRVEYEHTKFVVKKAVGFKPTYNVRKTLVIQNTTSPLAGRRRTLNHEDVIKDYYDAKFRDDPDYNTAYHEVKYSDIYDDSANAFEIEMTNASGQGSSSAGNTYKGYCGY